MHTALLRISEGGLALGGTYRNHPVSQVTVLRHLHGPQHGQVDVTSAMGKTTVSTSNQLSFLSIHPVSILWMET